MKKKDIAEKTEVQNSGKIKIRVNPRGLVKQIVFLFAISLALSVILSVIKAAQTDSFDEFFTAAPLWRLLLVACVLTIVFLTILVYMAYVNRSQIQNKKLLPVLVVSSAITFLFCIFFGMFVNIYIVPLMLSSLLVATLIGKRVGIITNIMLSQGFFIIYVLVFGSENVISSSASIITSMVASIFMITGLGRATTRLRFIVLGSLIGLLTSVLPFFVSMITEPALANVTHALSLSLWAFLAAELSVALYMILLPVLEFVFKLNSIFRLSEICSLEFPLLKRLSKEAPGTFNHSLAVGNLAELCAVSIGEYPQLAKAAAYYHDVGKLEYPDCFFENQHGYNPHDDFIPEVSVSMITSHTETGYKLIKKAGLPDILADVAREHHGTTPVNYFLYKAQNFTEENVDKKEFCYQDPKPSTKVAAIIMIVDTVEAATRAVGVAESEEALREYIHGLIKEKENLNQFTNCDLTFKDLQLIEDTLVENIPSIYHSRIKYDNKPQR